ncbi:MAG: imidazolonepropionase, partial [Bacteroides sp.]|nr:imidazolonepropionase [Bacteroides sp.]
MLIINIGCLVGADRERRSHLRGPAMKEIDTIADAWLRTDGELIADFGP